MTDISITLANGRRVSFAISEDGAGPPCFLLSVRKCGSSIVNNICGALAVSNGRCFVDVGDTFFVNNLVDLDWTGDPAVREILRPGVIYGGFRDAPLSLMDDPTFVAAPKLIMIRDPRDALVSEYFSSAYSHPLPSITDEYNAMAELLLKQRALAQSDGIQRYVVRRSRWMVRTMEYYAPILPMPNTVVVKYEDVILRKAVLIEHLARHFGMQATQQDVADILEWADVLPAAEDPSAFVRQVLPGDHAKKLDRATIVKLNEQLSEVMRLFGYS